jgi:hypothetical protein
MRMDVLLGIGTYLPGQAMSVSPPQMPERT